ncbi:hypothetical protein Ga0466249_001799 [Sporomusaceae bacterium BoRhaA]|jgi:hypothetical protein|nr:hypothetical protein [Pelorhabdus rhamnosifermentans]
MIYFFYGHTKIMGDKLNSLFLSILIGCFMASMSFGLNSYLMKHWNKLVVITLGPIIEEMSKSYLAWYLGAAIVLTHVIFGVIEGGYDLVSSRYGVQGCILSIGGHSLFGIVTVIFYEISGLVSVGILMASLCHIGYNIWVIYHFTN